MEVNTMRSVSKLPSGEYSNKALVEAYRKKAGIQDIELFVYHDARHEIYNELNKDDILQDLIKWINIRIG
jgi:alpha-beta hydrolase superfamily lysophospholipase